MSVLLLLLTIILLALAIRLTFSTRPGVAREHFSWGEAIFFGIFSWPIFGVFFVIALGSADLIRRYHISQLTGFIIITLVSIIVTLAVRRATREVFHPSNLK